MPIELGPDGCIQRQYVYAADLPITVIDGSDKRMLDRLIDMACLAPNRRVEFKFEGLK